MTYTSPASFPANTIVPSDSLNILSDDIADLNARSNTQSFFGVSLARTSSQSIADSTDVDIVWDGTNLDVGGWYVGSGADIVVPDAAIPDGYTTIYVEISGDGRFAVNGTGARTLRYVLNGTLIEQAFVTSGLSGDTTPVFKLVWAEVAAGDIIDAQVVQSSGGSLNLEKGSIHVKRIGPAS